MKRARRASLYILGAAAIIFFGVGFIAEPQLLWLFPAMFGHEAAHALAARRVGIVVARFGIGMGPVVRHLGTIRGTAVVISQWPVGAYVGMTRESHDNKTVAQRLYVSFAGVAFNTVLALLLDFAGLPLAAQMNWILAWFNIIPVLPLDGGVALSHVLPTKYHKRFAALSRPAIWVVSIVFVFASVVK